jgi:hypothetical protein
LHSIFSNEGSGKITRGVYVFEEIGSYINPGTTREGFGIRIAKLWLSLMLIEGEENLSLESRSVVSSAVGDCKTSDQLRCLYLPEHKHEVEVHPEGC